VDGLLVALFTSKVKKATHFEVIYFYWVSISIEYYTAPKYGNSVTYDLVTMIFTISSFSHYIIFTKFGANLSSIAFLVDMNVTQAQK
jgi:hypothetical protein